MSGDFKFLDVSKARNDSSMPVERVVQILQDGVTINYGELSMRVQRTDYEKAALTVKELTFDRRRRAMRQIERTLNRLVPKALRGTATKVECDDLYSDLMLWDALKRLSVS